MKLISVQSKPAPAGTERPLRTGVANHSHLVRNIDGADQDSHDCLFAWTRAHHVGAIGIGSPWSHKSGLNYRKHEGPERDRYYAGLIDPESVMDRDDIENMIRTLNEKGGPTFYYLDNETPKNRYGHLWHVGFAYQVPAWHDYSQDGRTAYSDLDPNEDPNPFDPTGRHIRRTYEEVVATQREAGALCVWAHPTSWWWAGEKFITNIAADMLPQLISDGYVDGMTVMGYDSYHRDYQRLWFSLLDRGYRIPGFAELDFCPSKGADVEKGHVLLNYIPDLAGPPTMDQMKECFRAARHTPSSGPDLRLKVDGVDQGGEIPSGAGMRHVAEVVAWPAPKESVLSRVELLGRGGEILGCVENFAGGTITFEIGDDDASGYLIARAFGENDGDYRSKPHQQVKHCAITNPVWLLSPSQPRPEPLKTELTILPGQNVGRPFHIVNAAGHELMQGTVTEAATVLSVPANTRLVIDRADGTKRVLPLPMANRKVRELMDYLADGIFLQDFPGCVPGVVPPEAFRFEEMRAALSTLTIEA